MRSKTSRSNSKSLMDIGLGVKLLVMGTFFRAASSQSWRFPCRRGDKGWCVLSKPSEDSDSEFSEELASSELSEELEALEAGVGVLPFLP